MEEFMKRVNGKFKSIIAFEMDEVNYKNLLNRINLYDAETKKKIFTYNCGVWNKKENIAFSNNGLRTSSILDNSQEVKDKENYFTVDLLDEIIDSRITYLKMDIEGAEKKALIGAEKIIKKYILWNNKNGDWRGAEPRLAERSEREWEKNERDLEGDLEMKEENER